MVPAAPIAAPAGVTSAAAPVPDAGVAPGDVVGDDPAGGEDGAEDRAHLALVVVAGDAAACQDAAGSENLVRC